MGSTTFRGLDDDVDIGGEQVKLWHGVSCFVAGETSSSSAVTVHLTYKLTVGPLVGSKQSRERKQWPRL